MLIVRDIKLPLGGSDALIKQSAAELLGVKPDCFEQFFVVKKSLDARKKQDIHYNCTVQVSLADESSALRRGLRNVEQAKPKVPLEVEVGTAQMPVRPFVIGAGPCGLFAAYLLAKQGYKPIIVERGSNLEKRDEDVAQLQSSGMLNPQSNIAFGEGGAGAYSDGKLTARSKDARSQSVLDILVELGAPPETAFLAKPHIGTDKLKEVLKAMRQKITAMGAEYWFDTRLVGLEQKDGKLSRVTLEGANGGNYDACICILAVGHSARDTYEMLLAAGCALAPKPFAVGLRIEHEQFRINKAQYGDIKSRELSAAEYALTATAKDGRGVFTFCMCPGGEVVCSSTEMGGVVTNGMSYHAREGKNANSAIVVQVSPDDYGQGALDGIDFARKLEQSAFTAGGGGFNAPVQKVGDFLKGQPTAKLGSLSPTYKPGVTPCNLHDILPPFASAGIAQAIRQFSGRLRGFDDPYALLTGVETRTSSPVRILRGDDLNSSIRGMIPAGDGAGYAGGIVSAAIDGLKAAQAVISEYSQPR